MTPAETIRHVVLPAAFHLLPEAMRSVDAVTLLMAIGYQESRFEHRRQIRGPARGFWQFEVGGVSGVLRHRATRPFALLVCEALGYEPSPMIVHEALEHNDILAACFARLLLWADPRPIPASPEAAWDAYIFGWNPGKPHPDTWAACFDRAQRGGVVRA